MILLLSRATFTRVIFKKVTGIMWTANSLGRSYISGKPSSKDLRSATGEFNGTYSSVARIVRVDHATVSKIWKQFCPKRTHSPQKKLPWTS